MLQSILFLALASVPIFLFLRRIRALKLSRGYALVLTVPTTIALWFMIHMIVDMGRM
jgi:hypothetical protein